MTIPLEVPIGKAGSQRDVWKALGAKTVRLGLNDGRTLIDSSALHRVVAVLGRNAGEMGVFGLEEYIEVKAMIGFRSSPAFYGRKRWLASRTSCKNLGFPRTQARRSACSGGRTGGTASSCGHRARTSRRVDRRRPYGKSRGASAPPPAAGCQVKRRLCVAEGLQTPHSSAMQPGRSDLADFAYFLAIAKHRSFRRAALELGISASALSHAIRGLENRTGVRLLNRTNRSVTLTAAGEDLQGTLTAPFEAIGEAVEKLNLYRDTPAGRIRLNVPTDAATLLLGPILPTFIDRYPDVQIDVAVNNHMIDVIEGGFDAGIRYGGTVPEDMVAQRLSADINWVVAGSPDYLKRFGAPQHPNDLQHHRCLRFRLGDDRIYRWEFERAEERIDIDVPGSVTLDDSRLIVTLLTQGAGLMYGPEPLLAPLVTAGVAHLVLEDWASPGPGFHIYYSSRRQVPNGLRLLIDLIREMRPLGF